MDSAIGNRLRRIRHVLLILSGKGGVGKSTLACRLSLSLATTYQLRVGLCDIDLCGPSIPTLMGLSERGEIREVNGEWMPHEIALPTPHTVDPSSTTTPVVRVVSLGFLLASGRDAVVWRGPRKDGMIRQFLANVRWGDLDVLVVDTPPGTSDEHITLCEILRAAGHPSVQAVVVSTPQLVAIDDVRKTLCFCEKLEVKVLGVVENMSGYRCPHCMHCTPVFGENGGRQLASICGIPYLGSIPIDAGLASAGDQGTLQLSTTNTVSDTTLSTSSGLVLKETADSLRSITMKCFEEMQRTVLETEKKVGDVPVVLK